MRVFLAETYLDNNIVSNLGHKARMSRITSIRFFKMLNINKSLNRILLYKYVELVRYIDLEKINSFKKLKIGIISICLRA